VARKAQTILQACVQVRGVHAGALTAAHVAQVAMTTAELGQVPSGNVYAEYWAVNPRTAFKQWEGIAEVFGPDWRVVVEQVAREINARRERKLRPITNFAVPARARVQVA
jgi:hypothetical protein